MAQRYDINFSHELIIKNQLIYEIESIEDFDNIFKSIKK